MTRRRPARGAAATVIGRAHSRDGLPCQDMAAVRLVGRDTVIAVVADGAGSAALSDQGAAVSVAAAVAFLGELRDAMPPEEAGGRLMDAVLTALTDHASMGGHALSDLASTLLAVAARRTDGGVGWTAFHLGDGVIAADLGDGVRVLSEPDNGEYGNATFFTTGAAARGRLRVLHGKHSTAAFALMTDGAAESLHLRRENRMAPAVATLFDWARTVGPMRFERALVLNLETVVATRTTDDVALAIVSLDCG